jgi:hypothetical protein
MSERWKETLMEAIVEYSRGPVLEPGVDQGVHIIFIPPDVEVDPGPNVLPSQAELDAAAISVPSAKATDVIVFKGRPWHLVRGRLEKHPEVHGTHPETVLKVAVEHQKVVWWSEHDFRVTRIELHDHATAASSASVTTAPPPKPFAEPETRREGDVEGLAAQIHVARSTPPIRDAKTFEYKITFTRNGRTIDPNMRCI